MTSMALSSWSAGTACSCSGRSSVKRSLAARKSTAVCGAGPRGGAAVLEREGTAAKRVEEVQPTSFELFTATEDAWAQEFSTYSSATETMESLASLQAELMSTMASMDSLMLAPLPGTAPVKQQGLDPEARRAKRQQARAARSRSSPPAAAATLVLAPPAPAPAPSRPLVQPPPQPQVLPTALVQLQWGQQQQQQPALAQVAAALPAPAPALSLAPAAAAPARQATRTAAARTPEALPVAQAHSALTSAPGLALQPRQQAPALGLALPAPAAMVPVARSANQARASRNSAGRTAVGAVAAGKAAPTAGAMDSAMSGDGTAQFFKMTSSVGLLKPEEQKEVAAVVKDYLSLKSIEKELTSILKRPPTAAEWAKAVKMDPSSFQARLRRGQEAKALMLKSNYRLVVKVVKAYQNRGLSLQDLITEGMQGLVKGVEKFEADKGFRFSTYAHWWIRQAVTRAVQEQGRAVRLPTHLHEQIARITMVMASLTKQLGRAPTMAEVGQEVGMPAERVVEVMAAARPSSSLETASVGNEDDGAAEAKDQLADERAQPDEVMENDNVAASVEAVLAQALSPREAGILRMHWGLDGRSEMTLEEIGAHFGVTRERVRQVEARAMRKLKESQLALPAGMLGELQAMSSCESTGTTARASRGTRKT